MYYLPFLNILWIATIIQEVVTMIRMKRTAAIRAAELLITFASLGLFIVMIRDLSLYSGSINFFGLRGIFAIVVFAMLLKASQASSNFLFMNRSDYADWTYMNPHFNISFRIGALYEKDSLQDLWWSRSVGGHGNSHPGTKRG